MLAECVGGVGWRSELAEVPGCDANPTSGFRCDCQESVRDSTLTSCLAVSVGGVTWRTNLADQLGGATWRSNLAEQLGGVGLAESGWRSGVGGVGLAEWAGEVGWRSGLAKRAGEAGWRSRLAE